MIIPFLGVSTYTCDPSVSLSSGALNDNPSQLAQSAFQLTITTYDTLSRERGGGGKFCHLVCLHPTYWTIYIYLSAHCWLRLNQLLISLSNRFIDSIRYNFNLYLSLFFFYVIHALLCVNYPSP